MKKYFVDYIPVEGKIKADDIWIEKDGTFHTGTLSSVLERANASGYKKVKMSLCTRDIQVGDTTNRGIVVSDNGKLGYYNEGSFHLLISEDLKPIGEISPKATWVKKGDEFDKEDLFANGIGHNWDDSHTNLKFKIKCPHCGQFL